MLANVPTLDIQQMNVRTVDIGQVAIGPITVGDLVLNDIDVSMSAAQAVLTDVSVRVSIHVSVDWDIHIGMPDWIPDIDVGDSYNLGTVSFGPINIGNVVIPGITNLRLQIPTMTAQNITAAADPIALHLANVTVDQVHGTNLTLPLPGFNIAGLTISGLNVNNVGVPAAKLDGASVGHANGDPLQLPALTVRNLNLPAAQVPQATSIAPLDIPADLSTQGVGFDAGILRVMVKLRPSTLAHVEHLELTNANASATIGQVVLHNVTLPYDALNLTLADIGINTIAVPSLGVA